MRTQEAKAETDKSSWFHPGREEETRVTLTARAETAARPGQHELRAAALLPAGHARLSNSPCFCDHRLQGFRGALEGRVRASPASAAGPDHALRTEAGPGPRPQDGLRSQDALGTAVCNSPWFASTEARTGEQGGSIPGFSSRRSSSVRAFFTTERKKTENTDANLVPFTVMLTEPNTSRRQTQGFEVFHQHQ